MNATQLRGKSIDELEKELVSLMKDQFTYRMQQSTGQLSQTHLLQEVRKEIARVKTVIREKKVSE